MNKRFGAIPTLVAAVAATAGLFAGPSNSAANKSTGGYCKVPFCIVRLTGTGPSPSNVKMHAANYLELSNWDSVTHTVAFANGLCSLTIRAGAHWRRCKNNFPYFAGSYPYTVDGKFPGTVVTTPLRRVVTLTARTQDIRRRARLTLHGRLTLDCGPCFAPNLRHYVSVIVLARSDSKHPIQPIATVNPSTWQTSRYLATSRWTLTVQPDATTTYIARVKGQLPQGRIWTSATSPRFTVRIRH